MKGALTVLANAVKQYLLFATPEDAKRFAELIKLYMTDSGAGNGYSAYWIFDDRVEETSGASDRFTQELDHKLVDRMVHAIAESRSLETEAPILPDLSIGRVDGAITFSIGEFAPRTSPVTGDMYRIFNWDPITEQHAESPREGRVIGITGDIAKVGSWGAEDEEGNLKPDAAIHDLPLGALMRIPDWQERNRERRKK